MRGSETYGFYESHFMNESRVEDITETIVEVSYVETQYSVIHFTLGFIQIDDVTAHIWHRHDSAPCAIRI